MCVNLYIILASAVVIWFAVVFMVLFMGAERPFWEPPPPKLKRPGPKVPEWLKDD